MVDLSNYNKNCEQCKQKLVKKSYEHPSHFIQRRFCNTSCSRLSRDMFTPEVRTKMSIRNKGNKNGAGNKGLKKPSMAGDRHWNWKGDNVKYRTLHKWVEIHLGKAGKCINDATHKSTRFHWANISKEYKRDLADWTQMCPSCNCKDRIGRRVSP